MALPEVSIPLIIGAGLIDGINPCAFAVLIFMMGYLTKVVKDKKMIIITGVCYIISVYASYMLIGLGLLSVVQLPSISSTVYLVAAFIAIITGVINVKDFFYYGQGITLRIPKSQKNRISEWVHKGSVPAAIVLGLFVSLFELPCTGSVYFVILALLSQSGTYLTAVNYLLLYNLMFVLPLIIMFTAIVLGYNHKKADKLKEEYKDWMKLMSGLLLIGLGIWMLLGIYG
ncbi:MAG: cytochrome c biogenesis protein CcdA [Candidatus Nanoarchaeia archaeon]|jgi:cytochrome c biogenesis protein CcdA